MMKHRADGSEGQSAVNPYGFARCSVGIQQHPWYDPTTGGDISDPRLCFSSAENRVLIIVLMKSGSVRLAVHFCALYRTVNGAKTCPDKYVAS